MTHGSLFSGIGGFELAAEWAGIETLWSVEIEPYCDKLLKRRFPNAKRFSNIYDVGAHNLERVDIISGGFPCQPFSVAGKRLGDQDERFLWTEMFRVIREIKPCWVIAENVYGLISISHGVVFEQVHRDLEFIGYETQTFIIPAVAVDAPHKRDRVWIVAHAA